MADSKYRKRLVEWIDERFPLSEFISRHITDYPTPRSLNYLWNFGSVAGIFFLLQVISGIYLAMYYKPDTELAFQSVQHIMRDVNYGYIFRYIHALGPTAIFIAMYIHIARGLYYGSYKKPRELIWWIGLLILAAFMTEAFTGYLLPWGQMSFWGATVITNLVGAIPIIGDKLTILLRGDFAVGDPTLTRFYAIHIALIPLGVIGGLLFLHLTALHRVGSNNPDGTDIPKTSPQMIPFHPYYTVKDLWFIFLCLTIFFYFVFFQPSFFLEPINNEPANPLRTPVHIVPEWYFLPFYAILRSVPHKLLGVVLMWLSMGILFFMPYLDRSPERSARKRPLKRWLTWAFFLNFILLGYVGMHLPDEPTPLGIRFVTLGRVLTVFYFAYFLTMPLWSRIEPIRNR